MLGTRVLSQGLRVSEIGLGCVGMSAEYGDPIERDEVQSLGTLERALELGVTLLDTADSYGPYTNELLLGRFLRGRRDRVVISTKVGQVLDPVTQRFVVNGRPDHLRTSCTASLRRLGVDAIDLYHLHRVDPEVPLEDSWGAMLELQDEGKVRALGICEVGVEELETAHRIAPVAAVQSELSLWTRGALSEVLPWCRAQGVGFIPYAPLGRGFLTGSIVSADFSAGDIRARNPRFSETAIGVNQAIIAGIKQVADRHRATPAQVAIAWTLAQGDAVVPIPGTKRVAYLEENVGAASLHLSADDLDLLSRLPEPMGSRY
jgi:aryl-alcohol dehydrogenase-like predicted oxidoreductase